MRYAALIDTFTDRFGTNWFFFRFFFALISFLVIKLIYSIWTLFVGVVGGSVRLGYLWGMVV